MNTSRTGPTIKINTARTSSETHRGNIQANLHNQPIHYNVITRQSPEKLPHLIPSNNNPALPSIDSTWRNEKGSNYFSFKQYTHKLEAQNQNNLNPPLPQTFVNFKKEPSPLKPVFVPHPNVQNNSPIIGTNIIR